MQRVNFRPEFKGDRDYVQGPDIYDAMCRTLTRDLAMRDVRDLRFSIHNKTASNLVFSLLEKNEDAAGAKVIARLAFLTDSSPGILIATEDKSLVAERKAFSEESVVRNGLFEADRQAFRIEINLPFSDIELWVSQNKRLLQLLFPEKIGKWWFVKAEFDRYSSTSQFGYSELRLLHNFNFRLTKSAVVVDGVERGFIYFSMA